MALKIYIFDILGHFPFQNFRQLEIHKKKKDKEKK